jgi:hypothetical protein
MLLGFGGCKCGDEGPENKAADNNKTGPFACESNPIRPGEFYLSLGHELMHGISAPGCLVPADWSKNASLSSTPPHTTRNLRQPFVISYNILLVNGLRQTTLDITRSMVLGRFQGTHLEPASNLAPPSEVGVLTTHLFSIVVCFNLKYLLFPLVSHSGGS